MKPDTQFFIDEVMDSIDYCFVDSREYEGAQQYLLDEIDDYTGPSIVVSFKASGDGMIRIDVFTEEKSANQKLVIMEDNLDIDQAVANINEMIVDVMTETEETVDYSEKMNFNDIYAGPKEEEPTEEETEGSDVIVCKAYLDDAGKVMLVFNDKHDEAGNLVCWTAEESHSSCDPYYPDECDELSAKDPRVKDAVSKYEDFYSSEQNGKIEIEVLPVGTMLPVQKETHKDILSRD